MKKSVRTLAVIMATSRLLAQGTMFVDQQSFNLATAITSTSIAGIGQSFTPALSGIAYVQLAVGDNDSGSLLYVNLRQGSLTGPIIGATDTQPVTTDDPHVPATFFFPFTVALNPGTIYVFEPVIVADAFQIGVLTSNPLSTNPYSGGSELRGAGAGNYSLWFSEGIIVPEPSTWALLGLGGLVMLVVAMRKRTARRAVPVPVEAATAEGEAVGPGKRRAELWDQMAGENRQETSGT